MEPVTFQEWVTNGTGKHDEVGTAMIITDAILEEYRKRVDADLDHVLATMEYGIVDHSVKVGMTPVSAVLTKKRDPGMRGEEVHLVARREFQGEPEQYMAMAHAHWLGTFVEADRLARLSLWGHLKQWWDYRRYKWPMKSSRAG